MKNLIKLAKSNKHLPVLQSIYFHGDTATATDYDIFLRLSRAPVTYTGKSIAMIPVESVSAALAISPTLAIDTDLQTINGVKFQPLDVSEFPQFTDPMPPLSYSCELSRADLDGVLLAASKDDVRYCLKGVLLDYAAGSLLATDGHRLHIINSGYAVPMIPGGPQFILPRLAAELLLKCAGKKGNIDVCVYVSPADSDHKLTPRIVAGAGQYQLECKPIDGKFPDISRVTPPLDTAQFSFKAGADDISAAAKRAEKINRAIGNKYNHVIFHKGAMGFPGDAAEPVRIESCTAAERDPSGVQAKYIADAGDFMDGVVTCQQAAADCCFRFDDGRRVAVVMPMRI